MIQEVIKRSEKKISDEQRNFVNDGFDAEKTICSYYDSLISCINPVGNDKWEKPLKHPCKKTFVEVVQDLGQDYIDITSSVQRHSKWNSAYCLRTDKHGNQYCRFFYPFDTNNETYIKYVSKNYASDTSLRPEIVGKRNDPRLNRHQQLQLQGWRANTDIQLIIDQHACVEYLAKCASKAEKISSIARDAFIHVMNNVTNTTSPETVIRRLMLRCVGERDI